MKETMPIPNVAEDKAPKGAGISPYPRMWDFPSPMKIWKELILQS